MKFGKYIQTTLVLEVTIKMKQAIKLSKKLRKLQSPEKNF